MSLWSEFLRDDHYYSMKWAHYFPVYERYFSRYVNRTVRMLEIGVWKGGSLQVWKRYLGSMAKITGIDINPTSQFQEFQITVCTGDQKDENFLKIVNEHHGPFDIILDDASHLPNEALASFHYLYPLMSPDGVYVIEDINSFYDDPVFAAEIQRMYFELNAYEKHSATDFTRSTMAIHLHECMVVFERGFHEKNLVVGAGTQPSEHKP